MEKLKPFYKIYAKKRSRFNLLRYIFGEYKYKFFEEGKELSGYKDVFGLLIEGIDLDVKDITFTKNN